MADLADNVSLNADEEIGDSSDQHKNWTLDADQDEDTPKTFKDLVG